MTITITLELNEENLDKVKALLPNVAVETKTEAKLVKKVKAVKQEVVAIEPVAPQVVIPVEQANETLPWENQTHPTEPVKPAVKITKEDIRGAALALAQAGKNDKIVEIFAKFGGTKLSDFDNKTEVYPAIMEAFNNA